MFLDKYEVFSEPKFPYLTKYSAKNGSYDEMSSIIPKKFPFVWEPIFFSLSLKPNYGLREI